MNEIWKSLDGIVECGEFYEVSNLGKVRSMDRYVTYKTGQQVFYKGKELKLTTNKNGYKYVTLKHLGKVKTVLVHRAVALAFIPNPFNFSEINHIDENKENNICSNLEWCTSTYNHQYGTRVERSAKKHCKPVKCWKYPSMEYITEFSSIKEASEFLGIKHSYITTFFYRKLKQTQGYYFEYVEGDENA